MIIGVTGTNGAGKGTVVDYLVQKGFTHYSVRALLVSEIQRRGLAVDRTSMNAVGNDLRAQHGPDYFVHFACEDARTKELKNIAIESIRNLGEAKTIAESGTLIAVDANRELRYQRSVARASDTDKVDFTTWVAQEEREWHNEAAYDMNVPGVMKIADYTVTNDGTLDELHAQIDVVLEQIKK